MTQEFKGTVQYTASWMKELMKDTVVVRIYADRVAVEMATLTGKIERGEDCDIRSTIAPLRYEAPPFKNKQHEATASIIKCIDEVCRSNNLLCLKEATHEVGIIYHKLHDAEYMFNGEKLEELPEWQSQLP